MQQEHVEYRFILTAPANRNRVWITRLGSCNNNCIFCNQEEYLANRDVFSCNSPLCLIEKVECTSLGQDTEIVLTGSEMTMLPWLCELVTALSKLYTGKITLETNGRMLAYERYAEHLAQCGVSLFSISLHSMDQAIHDQITRTSSSFAQTMQGLNNVGRLGAAWEIRCSLTRANLISRELQSIAGLVSNKEGLGISFSLSAKRSTGPCLKDCGEAVRPAIAMALDKGGIYAGVKGLPFCMLRGLESCVQDFDPLDLHKYHGMETPSDKCVKCAMLADCGTGRYGLLLKQDSADITPLTGLKYVFIPLSGPCDNHCIFCCKGDSGGKAVEPVQPVMKAIRRFDASRKLKPLIGGTEPLIHPGLFPLLHELKATGFSGIEIQTTGRRLSSMYIINKLAALEIKGFHIPIYGSTSEIHDKITYSKGSFKDTVQGIGNALNNGFQVHLHTLLLVQNKAQWQEVGKFAKQEFGLNVTYLMPFPDTEDASKYKTCVPRFSDVPRNLLENMDIGIPCIQNPDKKNGILKPSMRETMILLVPPKRRSTWVKLSTCSKCSVNSSCTGIWPGYLEVYGDSEFKPILSNP
ncbi:MAG: radical SAM protein [Deltaproteobacteria bacterium]|nr:radical SAM protein [Deltaproteobacteria bacterium]